MALLTPSAAGVGAALANGARVVWTGAPEPGVRMRPGDLQQTLFGIPWTAFAVFWTVMAWRASPGFFPLWGMMFICVGVYVTAGHYFWDAYVRSRLTYAITDDGVAYIISGGGQKTESIYLPTVTDMRLQSNGGSSGTILFGPGDFGGSMFGRNRANPPPAFQYVKDAQKVFEICTQYQKKP